MPSDLIFSLRDVDVRFGKKEIFNGLNLNIHQGDLIALVGKNGVGKTTLMKIIMGTQELDNGELWNFPNLKVSYFTQQFELDEFEKAAGCTMQFSENPNIASINASIQGNKALPALADRLPEEPLVVRPYDTIGKYRGTINFLSNAT